MDRVITNFIEAPFDEGNVMLIDMPPGTGKTYASTKAIAEYVKFGGERRILFVTPLKKNLPGDSGSGGLWRAFERAYKDELSVDEISEKYNDCVIQLESVAERPLRQLAELTDAEVDDMRDFLDDEELADDIDSFRRLVVERGSEPMSEFERSKIVDGFRPVENNLRHRIHDRLDSGWRKPSERLEHIRRHEPWIRTLYPEVEVFEKKVILLTASKFVYPFDPVVDRPCQFYESDLLEGAVVFMDEFDSIKMDWLNQIVKTDGRSRVNVVDMFCRIHTGLMNRENHDRRYYLEARSLARGSKSGRSLKELADDVAAAFDEEYKAHNLAYDFKLENGDSAGFVFRGYDTISVGRSNRYAVDFDRTNRVNMIVDRTKDDQDDLEAMFRGMDNRLRYFEGLIASLAYNQQVTHRENDDEVPYEQCIRTVLEPYKLDRDQRDYLVQVVMYRSRVSRLNNDPNDLSVYARGYTHFSFEDGDDHGLNSHIYRTAYYRSPEGILMSALSADDVKIIGVSATATLATSVRNFDLRYLRHVDGFRLYAIPEDDGKLLQNAFDDATRNYEAVNISALPIDPDDADDIMKEIPDLDTFFLIHEEMEDNEKERYERFAVAYREFIRNSDIKSMLCFMTLHAKPKGGFRIDYLRDICRAICEGTPGFDIADIEDTGKDGRAEPRYFEILKGDGFESEKERIIGRLAKGKKVFVLTSYQTVGAGQNLQYTAPESLRDGLVRVNDYRPDDFTKDFDCVYLDGPTNVIPVIFDPGDTEGLAKYIFETEFLRSGKEISNSKANENIRKAFNRFCAKESRGTLTIPSAFKYTESAMNGAMRDVIQGIGRMCRTGLKSQNVYVMADSNISKYVSSDISVFGKRLNKEFVEFHKEFCDLALRTQEEDADDTDQASEMAGKLINRYLKFSWDQEKMEEWEDLREKVLRHPTFAENEGGMLAYGMYCEVPEPSERLIYREDDKGAIHLGPGSGTEAEVSAEAARLPELLEIPGVGEWFETHRYATSFEPNVRIISPRLFKNIYLGALGEAVGRCVFEAWGVHLNPITDPAVFEKFDFVADNGMYVDFKHWRATPGNLDEKGLDEAFSKLRDGETAVIVNILRPEGDIKDVPHPEERGDKTVWTVPYLYDGKGLNRVAYKKIMEVFR